MTARSRSAITSSTSGLARWTRWCRRRGAGDRISPSGSDSSSTRWHPRRLAHPARSAENQWSGARLTKGFRPVPSSGAASATRSAGEPGDSTNRPNRTDLTGASDRSDRVNHDRPPFLEVTICDFKLGRPPSGYPMRLHRTGDRHVVKRLEQPAGDPGEFGTCYYPAGFRVAASSVVREIQDLADGPCDLAEKG